MGAGKQLRVVKNVHADRTGQVFPSVLNARGRHGDDSLVYGDV